MDRVCLASFVTFLFTFPSGLEGIHAGQVPGPRYELRLGQGNTAPAGAVKVPLTLSSAQADIQGLVVVFEWDAAQGSALGLESGTALAEADLVSIRADAGANYMILGVVMDSDGQNGEVIPAGEDILLAEAEIQCNGDEDRAFALRFVDETHALVDGGPALENIVIDSGLSFGAGEGLVLTDGEVNCRASATALKIESAQTDPTNSKSPDCADVRVLLSAGEEVGGYVTAICHDPAVLRLDSIVLGDVAVANNADFQQANILENGGTLGVIVDLQPPFGNAIPAGEDQHVATYRYCCIAPPGAGAPDVVTPLNFCDLQLGTPPLDNLVVIGSVSVNVDNGLILEDGEFRCTAPSALVEICDNAEDDDGDAFIDCNDPDCFLDVDHCPPPLEQVFACGARELDADGNPQSVRTSPGASVDICFFIKNPEDNRPPRVAVRRGAGVFHGGYVLL